jgi:hypothetical protein
MINLWEILANTLWVIGLAIVFAVWSYARYTAKVEHVPVKNKLNVLKYALVMRGGLFLFLCGMALTERRPFARILWILCGIGVIVESTMRYQIHREDKSNHSAQPDDTGQA